MAASNASVGVRTQSPSYQAYQILQLAFVVAPLIAGADKFFHFLVNWDQYLSPLVTRMLPISGHTFMLGVGLIEIVAGLLVAFMPAIGGLVVGAWLCGIIRQSAIDSWLLRCRASRSRPGAGRPRALAARH